MQESPPKSSHWLDKVLAIFQSDLMDLRELAKLAGANPEHFYRGVDFTNVDLRGQDLRGLDFTGSDLRRAKIDPSTLLDKKLESALSNRGKYRHVKFPGALLDEASLEARRLSISRPRLFRLAIHSGLRTLTSDAKIRQSVRKLRRGAMANKYFRSSLKDRNYQTFRIDEETHKFILGYGKNFPGVSGGYIAIVLIGFESLRVRQMNDSRRTARRNKSASGITGRRLNQKLSLDAKHALYNKDGSWYDKLQRFPGVLFDRRGYVLFDNKEAYDRCPEIRHPQHTRADGRLGTVHVPNGISNIPEYIPDDRITALLANEA
jgi:5-methylcytosine-specific restriction protein A